MSGLIDLMKGWTGKPSHPPLTDVAIGGYTVAVLMLVLGVIGVQEPEMAHGSLLALTGGLGAGALAAITGLLDWLDIPKGTPARTVATAHLLVMVTATVLFAATWLLQRPGYNADDVRTVAMAVGVAAELVLAVGGYLGGTLVFVYGVRSLGRRDVAPRDAVIPGRAEAQPVAEVQDGRPRQ